MTTERWRDTLACRRLESEADATRFFELARRYARQHGVRKLGSICGYCAVPAFVYEDELVVVSADVASPALEIVFKYPDGRLTNPVIMVTEQGENIRTHGEHCYVVPHLEALIARSKT